MAVSGLMSRLPFCSEIPSARLKHGQKATQGGGEVRRGGCRQGYGIGKSSPVAGKFVLWRTLGPAGGLADSGWRTLADCYRGLLADFWRTSGGLWRAEDGVSQSVQFSCHPTRGLQQSVSQLAVLVLFLKDNMPVSECPVTPNSLRNLDTFVNHEDHRRGTPRAPRRCSPPPRGPGKEMRSDTCAERICNSERLTEGRA
eukprot:gene14754-biopygen1517